MRHGQWRPTAAKPICMALGITVGPFLRIFGLGLWLEMGNRLPLGSHSFFCSALEVRDDCPVAVACFLPLGWRVFAFVGLARAKTSSPSADACWIFLGGFLLEFGFRSFLWGFCASFFVYAVATWVARTISALRKEDLSRLGIC